ncbi:hypothetical protein AALA98_07050 [Lachnospiraceae bacterium 45-W7]
MRIAIIDEGIDRSKLKYPQRVVKQITWDGQPFTDNVNGRHATCCACILEDYAAGYELVDIRIAENWNHSVSIKKMAAALELCIKEHIDIICLSIGTTFLSDGTILTPLIKKLSVLKIKMVSALSNKGYMTLPAAYENVICAVQDWKGQLAPGECRRFFHSILGEVVVANTRLHSFTESWEGNSFASPVAAAHLIKYPDKAFPTAGTFDKYQSAASNDNPVVAYISSDIHYEASIIMDYLLEADNLESVAIIEHACTDDIRIITPKNDIASRPFMIEEADKCVDCSLIFSLYNWNDTLDDYAYDITVLSYEKRVVIRTDDAKSLVINKNLDWKKQLCHTLVELLN